MAVKNIDELAKFVKGGADVLQKAISSEEEVNLEFVAGSFVSDEQLDSLKSDVFESGKKEGNKIGYDFALKDVKKDFGIDIEGKDRKEIVKAVSSKIMSDAKLEPSKKIQELESSLESLQKTYQTDLSAKNLEVEKLSNKVRSTLVDTSLMGYIPDGLDIIKPSQFAMLAKGEYEFDFNDNNELVAKKGGNVLKDKMEKPIPVKEILTDFATQNKWINAGGRGGGHETGGDQGFKSMNEVYKHMEQNKIDPQGPEGEKLINEFKNSQN